MQHLKIFPYIKKGFYSLKDFIFWHISKSFPHLEKFVVLNQGTKIWTFYPVF